MSAIETLIWALAFVALTGLVLGLLFRLPAVAAASPVAAAAATVISIAVGLSAAAAAMAAVSSLCALQVSYLVGAAVRSMQASPCRERRALAASVPSDGATTSA